MRSLAYSVEDEINALRTVYGEERSQLIAGETLVMWVIRNRAFLGEHTWGGASISGVCRAPGQFSCWSGSRSNSHNLNAMLDFRPGSEEWTRLLNVFHHVMSGTDTDPTRGATYYYYHSVPEPAWAKGKTPCLVYLGNRFYSLMPNGSSIPESAWEPHSAEITES